MIQHEIQSGLADPESAQFKLGPDQTGTDEYCGIVNAKNAMGGYAGFRPFKVFVVRDKAGRITKAHDGSVMSVPSGGSDDLLAVSHSIAIRNCKSEGFTVDY